MLDALKSRKMTGFSASCKNASPLAAPSATFILIAHERAWPWLLPTDEFPDKKVDKKKTHLISKQL
jgi:hypothetical protein